jgi:hypothetical protein
MRRWTGVSAAVGSAAVAALTGAAWAGSSVAAVPAPRSPAGAPGAAHGCGHDDSIVVSDVTPVEGGTAESVAVQALDGAGDPVDASFDGTALRVTVPGQRHSSVLPARAAASSRAPAVEVRTVLPAADRPRSYELRTVATFDDGITECRWTTRVVVPPR